MLPGGPSGMIGKASPPFALVQFAQATSVGNGSTTTVTLPSPPTAGNLLVLGVANYENTNPATQPILTGPAMGLIQACGPAKAASFGTAFLYSRVAQAGDAQAFSDGGAGLKNNGLVVAEFSGLAALAGAPVTLSNQNNTTPALVMAPGGAGFRSIGVFMTGQQDGGSSNTPNGASTPVNATPQYLHGGGPTGVGGIVLLYGAGDFTIGGTFTIGFGDPFWCGAAQSWARA